MGPEKKHKRFPISNLVRKRRKSDHCLNCGTDFDRNYNFCPNCGQENNHNQVSFGTLVADFLNNYFSLDSKFSMSLLPFFIKPGYLTIRFIEGKRASFVNPIRLYLIISLLFFFVFNMISRDIVQQSVEAVDKAKQNLSDSSRQALDKVITGEFDGIESDTVIELSGIAADSSKTKYELSIEKPDSTNLFLTEKNIQLYMKLRNNYDYSVEDILDSLETSELTLFQYNFTKQLIRLDRAENHVVVSQFLKNLPIMMLFTLPFFALLLKLFYIRRNQYYITHLVHAFHLHSLAYIVYAFVFTAAMYWLPEGAISNITVFLGFVVVSVYSYLSFLNVYNQGWFKTLIKFLLIGFLYNWLLLFAVFVEMVISVYTY